MVVVVVVAVVVQGNLRVVGPTPSRRYVPYHVIWGGHNYSTTSSPSLPVIIYGVQGLHHPLLPLLLQLPVVVVL